MLRVRGIGVALSERTSTFPAACFIFSFCATPKRCSSSTMSRPRLWNFISLESSLCVPMMRSISPRSISAIIFFCCLSVRKRESISTFTANARIRLIAVW